MKCPKCGKDYIRKSPEYAWDVVKEAYKKVKIVYIHNVNKYGFVEKCCTVNA